MGCPPRASVPTLHATHHETSGRFAAHQRHRRWCRWSRGNCFVVYAVLSKIYLASFSQEVGAGFKKASDSELVNRRCARPSLELSNSQLNFAILPQGKGLAKTRIAWCGYNSSTHQFRTIGVCSNQTRPYIAFLTLDSLLANQSLPGSVASAPREPTRARSPSAHPLLPQRMPRTSQHQHPPFHQTFRPRHRPQRLPQALLQPKSSPHSLIRVSMGSPNTHYQLRLLRHVRRRIIMLHILSIRVSVA